MLADAGFELTIGIEIIPYTTTKVSGTKKIFPNIYLPINTRKLAGWLVASGFPTL